MTGPIRSQLPPSSGAQARFRLGFLAAAAFTLGLAACDDAGDDVTGTVPADPAIEEAQPVEPVTPTE